MPIVNPLISVIVPNYNHCKFLEERLDTIFSQTYQNFEVILLDDCSTDGSKEILEKYSNHPKVSHLVFNKENSGSNYKQWNLGVSYAKGDLIWIAESDDSSSIYFLEKLSSSFTEEEIVLAYCQSNRMNSKGEITGDWFFQTDMLDQKLFSTDFTMKGIDFVHKFLLKTNVIPNASGVVFRKSSYELAKGANEDIKYCADWLLWITMLVMNGNIFYTQEKYNNFRFVDGSVIATSSKTSLVPFIKRYDILMRKRMNEILSQLNINLLLKINLQFLKKEILEEVIFLSKQKKTKALISLIDFKLFFIHLSLRQKISVIKQLILSI
jgi:glycosyltransferase involved in cell wall biosynthesis